LKLKWLLNMNDAQDYDSKNLDVLRRDLEELRSRAREEGVISQPAEKPKLAVGGVAARRFAAIQKEASEKGEAREKGKQLATRMLTMLRRSSGDNSPIVPGTDFTEQGVERLMNQLTEAQKSRRATSPLIQRLHNLLTTSTGGRTIAGASVERIRMIGNLLPQIETHGWEQVRSQLAKRKENRAAETEEGAGPPVAAARPGRRNRRAPS
jgi:hypothetical protein